MEVVKDIATKIEKTAKIGLSTFLLCCVLESCDRREIRKKPEGTKVEHMYENPTALFEKRQKYNGTSCEVDNVVYTIYVNNSLDYNNILLYESTVTGIASGKYIEIYQSGDGSIYHTCSKETREKIYEAMEKKLQ